ncbi:hypothetical protein AAX05_06120 [Moraxella bovoculi]|uniref:Uncharacterized protein n=1 Tax=Moraxella bovoculi TaxID=386891 RepID=A0AAC8T7U1_9GAMM|nr:hypothetical protein [Moraxella bovoculi]AKG07595.1 hypothetical protein AAX06_04830 [Moraxella bovoculi]AKG09803.1 hypothetical protein AAX05_06120 [Moraxella bovoculi]AKG11721.1 hypothetical protein AAX07_06675 [Moraxella bovoculi]AKG13688.1 hypothetical protein AAX11_06205 [Moraxella bovoculi]
MTHYTVPAKQMSYLIRCDELGILAEFKDFDTAHTFATQLAQDYPTAHIERAKYTQYFDSWDEQGQDLTGGEL